MTEENETTEMWREHKKAGQNKRASNRSSSTSILESHGIEFERKNMGAHLVVHGPNGLIDFWPGTGKFIVRGGETGRGIKNLLRVITCNG